MAKFEIDVSIKNGIAVKKLDKDLNKLETTNKKVNKSLDTTSSTVSTFTKALGALGVAFVGLQLGRVATDIIRVSASFQSLTTSLNAATGSAESGAKAFEFLVRESDRLGLSLEASTRGFKDLSAAAKGTELQGEAVENIFLSVSEASAVMGLTVDDTNGVFRALSQIMSKGTVQAEELRGQLGERIPGAFQIASRAMGVTTQELGKMLEQGQVVSTEFLPLFANELTRTFGESIPNAVTTAQKSFTRFNNELQLTKVAIGESGLLTMSGIMAEVGSTSLKAFQEVIKGFQLSTDESEAFKNSAIEGTKALITGLGSAYDILETLGDGFGLILPLAETAFFGAQSVIATVSRSIREFFENTFNFIIDGINRIISLANSTGLITISPISKVDFGLESALKEEIRTKELFEGARGRVSTGFTDLTTSGTGQDFAKRLIEEFDRQLSSQRPTRREGSGGTVISTPSISTPSTPITEFTQQTESLKQEVKKINEALEDTSDSFDNTYEVITKGNDNLSDTLDNFSDAIGRADRQLDRLVVQFNRGFTNSIQQSIGALSGLDGIYSQVTQQINGNKVSQQEYSSALLKAKSFQDQLEANPLSVGLAQNFNEAVRELQGKVSGFLVASNFQTSSEFEFAKAQVSQQFRGFETAANVQEILLTNIGNLIGVTNEALADGNLTANEIKTINDLANGYLSTSNSISGTGNQLISNVASLTSDGNLSLGDLISLSSYIQGNTGLTAQEVSNVGVNTSNNNSLTNTSNSKLSSIDGKVGRLKSSTTEQLTYLKTANNPVTNEPYVYPVYQDHTTYRYYADGGYTGDGGKFQEAGIVHKGEYVLSQDMLKSIGGVKGVESLLSGNVPLATVSSSSNNTGYTELVREIRALRAVNEQMRQVIIRMDRREQRYDGNDAKNIRLYA